jgi:predicted peroxiredoxin
MKSMGTRSSPESHELKLIRVRPKLSGTPLVVSHRSEEASATNPPRRQEIMTKRFIQATYGPEDPEKAKLPFIIAHVDQDVTIFLTDDAVRLATKATADQVSFGGHPSVGDILTSFVDRGGQVLACGVCVRRREISSDQLVDCVTVVSAANVTEALVEGAKTIMTRTASTVIGGRAFVQNLRRGHNELGREERTRHLRATAAFDELREAS